MSILDLTGTYWKFNNTLSLDSAFSYSLSFISNGNEYSTFQYVIVQQLRPLRYNTTNVYNATSQIWNSEAYKTIKILGGTDANNASLITWIEANATQIYPLLGNPIVIGQSSGSGGFFTVTDTQDPVGGGTIRTITPTAGTPIIQNSKSVTITNNTTTTIVPDTGRTALGSVEVITNVNNGGGYTFVGGGVFTVNTSSTSAATLQTLYLPLDVFTADKILYIKIRDKAGPRAGYFLGSDSLVYNYRKANSSTSSTTIFARATHYFNASNEYGCYTSNTGYGVYPYQLTSAGALVLYTRYNSSYSMTINGTYSVEVYLLDYPPVCGNPYNYNYSTITSTITFSVAGVSYTAKEMMSWGEWLASAYNTDGFVIYNNYIYNNSSHDGAVEDADKENFVYSYDMIKPNHAYDLNYD